MIRSQVKAIILSLRMQGASMNQIAEIGVSSRTVSKLIKRNGYLTPWTLYDQRRLPHGRTAFIKVKISRVKNVLCAWLKHYDNYGEFDLEAVMNGERPP